MPAANTKQEPPSLLGALGTCNIEGVLLRGRTLALECAQHATPLLRAAHSSGTAHLKGGTPGAAFGMQGQGANKNAARTLCLLRQ